MSFHSVRRWLKLNAWQFFWLPLAVVLLIGWTTGQIQKDQTLLSGLLFYFPSPVAATLLLTIALFGRRRNVSRRQRMLLLLLPVLPLFFVLGVENQWLSGSSAGKPTVDAAAAEAEEHYRLVHWNIAWSTRWWPAQRDLLKSLNPDICVLSETTAAIEADDFPGYQILRVHNMLIAARGPMAATGSLVPGGIVRSYVVQCPLDQLTLKIMVADVASPPSLPRNPSLRKMMQAAFLQQADIIVGDMNAPRRSLAFSDMQHEFQHAYDAAGSGWSYTWPVPVPVFALDQCICGPKVRPLNYSLRSTTLSDHRIQILDFTTVQTKTSGSSVSYSSSALN